mmetsp:Transcript_46492/g.87094  ORF Transcript_46492/g.87094 Transcript_46492/m.87094 type:complete len:123 (-) Transcript_46492:103-471(-)
MDFAQGVYNNKNSTFERPVLFSIKTQSRGAPVLRWSKYPDEYEMLLLPFQRFVVEDVSQELGILTVHLQTIAPQESTFMYQVICQPGLAYRYSCDVTVMMFPVAQFLERKSKAQFKVLSGSW